MRNLDKWVSARPERRASGRIGMVERAGGTPALPGEGGKGDGFGLVGFTLVQFWIVKGTGRCLTLASLNNVTA
jgi:hypothetical protein